MTRQVNVHDAKTHLSRLLADVESGEEIVIARGNVPIARLVGIADPARRTLGYLPGHVTDAFFEPLPAEEIVAWES